MTAPRLRTSSEPSSRFHAGREAGQPAVLVRPFAGDDSDRFGRSVTLLVDVAGEADTFLGGLRIRADHEH